MKTFHCVVLSVALSANLDAQPTANPPAATPAAPIAPEPAPARTTSDVSPSPLSKAKLIQQDKYPEALARVDALLKAKPCDCLSGKVGISCGLTG